MLGGLYLCYEGVEKLAHKLLHPKGEDGHHREELKAALVDPQADLKGVEADKIKGAIRTDFILSAEIIVITLGTVAGAAFGTQVAVLVGIALIMTVGVYGLVAGIVKLDDAGLWLSRREGQGPQPRAWRALGAGILAAAPWLMKALSVIGTAAMFLVGGGILVHGLPWLHHAIHGVALEAGQIPAVGAVLAGLVPTLINALVGVLAGALALGAVTLGARIKGGLSSPDRSGE
jgi:predicted DNA repair protein MutK